MSDTQVLIVGAGPVGLTLAIDLGQRGIKTILPHVDEFRPIHNLDSIAELCKALSAQGGQGNMQEWLKKVA